MSSKLCSPRDVPFSESSDFLLKCLHMISLVSTPVHMYCMYCILVRSSNHLSSMKSTFTVFYSTNIIFNYLLGFLDSPYILLPALAGSPLGMMRYFSIPSNVQVYFLVASLASVIISMPILFERWFHEMITKQSRTWNKWRPWWIFSHYLVVVGLVLIGIIETPEQNESNRAKVIMKLPCLSEHFPVSSIFILSLNFSVIVISFTVLVLIIITENLFITMLLLLLTSDQVQSGKLSSLTFRKQKIFNIKIHLQVLIPLPTLIVPLAYCICSIFFDYYNQILNNFVVISAALHGIISSLVLVIIHEEYRLGMQFICRRILGKRDHRCHVATFERRSSRVIVN